MPQVSIIIPMLNEAPQIQASLQALQTLREEAEIIVADGGSCDNSMQLAQPLVDRVVRAPRGRASQMNAGASQALGPILLFLHADTRLPEKALQLIQQGIAAGRAWGHFDVRLESEHPLLKVVALLMNWRSRLTGIATGDQAQFMTRAAFQAVGGFPAIALMEDIALSKRLKPLGKPYCITTPVTTSARRWEQHGMIKTILLMWHLRLGYFLGVPPDKLARRYYG